MYLVIYATPFFRFSSYTPTNQPHRQCHRLPSKSNNSRAQRYRIHIHNQMISNIYTASISDPAYFSEQME